MARWIVALNTQYDDLLGQECVLEWYSPRKSRWFTQEVTIHNIHCYAKVVGAPMKCQIQPQMLSHVLFFVLPFSSSCKEKNEYIVVTIPQSYLYAVLLGFSPTSFSFLAALWYTTFKTCPEAAGANSDSKQLYFPRGKTQNFPFATSPVLLKTGWESGCRSLSSGDGV